MNQNKKQSWKKVAKAVIGTSAFTYLFGLNTFLMVETNSIVYKIFFLITGIILYFIFLEYFEMQEKLKKEQKENENTL